MPRCDQGPRGSAETENTAHESDEDGVEIYGRAYARLRTRAGRLGKGRADPAQGEACRPRGWCRAPPSTGFRQNCVMRMASGF
jgi:hypothetical protein